jgi:hypothetical protein
VSVVVHGHKSLKSECIRPGTPLTREDAFRLIQTYVDHYNTVRLHRAIRYVTPQDMLAGRRKEIDAARDQKLEEARRSASSASSDILWHYQVDNGPPSQSRLCWRAVRDIVLSQASNFQ